jgi:2,4-dienoyl-CoA reductase-like NADH-dependent reductase (Old Yellow Enzyme family)
MKPWKDDMPLITTASVLFSPKALGSVTIPNRFVRSATHDFMAEEDGSVTERNVELYRRLAEGEVGLIISGHAHVNPAGKASPRQIGVHRDSHVAGLRLITQAVHEFAGRVFLQLAHAGRQTRDKDCGGTPVAPSAVFEPVYKVMPREMTGAEVQSLVHDFVRAGGRAREAGFDGVQLHGAHGYLLSAFFSPHTNRRLDEWGGSTEKRARVAVEILRGIKRLCGPDYPVIIKLNSSDFLPDGLEVEESVALSRILEKEGLDGIEVSGGTSESGRGSMWPGLRAEDEEGYFAESAGRVKAAVSIPVFGLGGYRTFRVMERAVASGRVDFISLSRPFVREPGLVKKFRLGEVLKSECISCNKCFNPRGLACSEIREKKTGRD